MSFSDRADIAVGIQSDKSERQIAAELGRDHTIIWRERERERERERKRERELELERNSTKTRGHRPVSSDCTAERRLRRPQARKIETDVVLAPRVKADLARSRTPRQIVRPFAFGGDGRQR